MFDLTALDTAAADDGGVWVPIKHPKTDEPLGIDFRVRSKNCDPVRAKSKRYISRLQTDRDFREKGKVDLDAAEAHRIEVLALCTVDWRSYDTDAAVPTAPAVPAYRPEICISGEWIAFSPARVREVFENKGWSWLRAQVGAAADDESNFLPKGVPPSTRTPNTSSPSAVPTTRPTPALAA